MADRRGTVTIISAFVLPILIGVAALVAEFGHGLLIKIENQRVADLAAYAGAVAYSSSSSTTTMNAAISNVATLNGLPSSAVSGSLIASPSGNGNQAVSVSVQTTKLLLLAPVLRAGSSLPVASSAAAEIAAQSSGCVIALSGSGTGVTLSGGTSLTASSCTVASNAAVSVPCGTTITTKKVTYNSASAPSQPCSGIQPPSGTSSVQYTKTSTPDPLSGNSAVTTATSRLATVAAYTAPAAPTVPAGTDINFGYGTGAVTGPLTTVGCTGTFASPVWTVTCPSGATVNMGNITLSGGITVNFNTGGSSTTTYNFSGSVNNSGTALNFGPGRFNIKGGIVTGGGTTTTFGAGTFSIGGGSTTCGSGTNSICHSGTTLTFGGPSTFSLSSGIYVAGAAVLNMGSGTTNSYQIGASSTGNSFYLAGGSQTKLADALGGSSVFTAVGNVNVASGGGSCFALPAAAQHDVKGFFSTAGGTILGDGIYTVTGYVALGANGGGNVTCWGSSVGIDGSDVTFTIGASSTLASGTCSGQAFCVAGGYSSVTLSAPTTGTMAKLLVIGPTSSSNTSGALFTAGASGTVLSGAFYLPYGPITLSGAASVGSGAGQCLQFIGSQVSLGGGSALASSCIGAGSGSSQTAVLIR